MRTKWVLPGLEIFKSERNYSESGHPFQSIASAKFFLFDASMVVVVDELERAMHLLLKKAISLEW